MDRCMQCLLMLSKEGTTVSSGFKFGSSDFGLVYYLTNVIFNASHYLYGFQKIGRTTLQVQGADDGHFSEIHEFTVRSLPEAINYGDTFKGRFSFRK
jgi:hypothetical protein